MKRGSIYWVNLEPTQPPEFGKVRPALVISNSEHNLRLPTVVVIPISSQSPEIWPLRLGFKIPGTKSKESFAVIPGIRQVNKTRLMDMIGIVSPSFLKNIDEALMTYLGED